MPDNNKKNDVFADIAAGGIHFEGKDLIEPQPPLLEERYLAVEGVDHKAVFEPIKKMNTEEELLAELEKQRERLAPFMKRFAPSMKSFRQREYLKAFKWRVATDEDKKDFQGVLSGKGMWEDVTIPHYGGPLGKVMTYYRTTLNVTQEQLDKGAIFIGFKGVDYKAHVFINGCFLGSHEGFFAPFEFEFSECAKLGENTLVVSVENDFIFGGSDSDQPPFNRATGDKIYAATGPGYDDPERGWHHCPPGMGIYQEVYVEARPRIFISDLFIRPMENLEYAEAWVEIYNCDPINLDIKLNMCVYGENFEDIVFENFEYLPTTGIEVGMGDSFTEAILRANGQLNTAIPLSMQKGTNRLIVPFKIPKARIWELETPWLYQMNVELIVDHKVVDTKGRHFGMRSFKMDVESETKGAMYLNGRQIRLRGANTMGHEQQCVMKGDFEQLIDDILLAKICNMNFLRITQRPVQSEVYDYCDRLGLMIQTDLPLFGVMGRSKFCEGVKQAEEMERLIRSHPCCIMVTYINEPFPNASNKPHRFLTRPELMEFFKVCDSVVKLNNPDRVIKHVDGDYDPPSTTLPDNHCYPTWYNGHGIDIGRLHRGYWLPVRPGWYYGCGEYGAEGLEALPLMRRAYPKGWLPQTTEEEKTWSPSSIVGAQTGKFHYFFYETPESLEDWVTESQKHQAWGTSIMTEAFRRDSRMTTFAIHLFIDAFPSGWMKTIMDVDRTPKPAYFAYKNALEPLMLSIRTDRFKFFEGEDIKLEAWVCNDEITVPENAVMKVMIKTGDKVIATSWKEAIVPSCSAAFNGYICYKAPEVKDRTQVKVILALCNAEGKVLNNTSIEVEIIPRPILEKNNKVIIIGKEVGIAQTLLQEIGLERIEKGVDADVILVDDYELFKENEEVVHKLVEKGAKLIFLALNPGEYDILNEKISVKTSGMMPLHFVSRKTSHRLIEGFKADDFRLWYSPKEDYIKPIMESTFTAHGFKPVLLSGNTNEKGEWGPALAVGEKKIGQGSLFICQIDLAGRTHTNPIAMLFAQRLLNRY